MTSTPRYTAANDLSIRLNSGEISSRDHQRTLELRRSIMRLQQQRRQKCGETASGEMSIMIVFAPNEMEHFEASDHGNRIPASFMGIAGFGIRGYS